MEQIIINPKHSWFDKIKLIITPQDRTWKDRNTDKIITKYKIGDSFSLEDFRFCFEFLSTEYNVDTQIALDILNTIILEHPRIFYGKQLAAERSTLRTYEDFFNIIGVDSDSIILKDNQAKIIKKVNSYPDSVFLNIKYKDENIKYSYCR